MEGLNKKDGKNNSPQKIRRKYLSNVHKKGVHLQCVNNYYAKFEYKGMKTFGVGEYTKQTPAKHF